MKTAIASTCTALLLAAFSFSAHAASQDCAPLDHLAGYQAYSSEEGGAAERREFEAHAFPHAGGERVEVKGRFCTAHYTLLSGQEEPATTVLVQHYRQAFDKLGAKVQFQDGCEISALLVTAGGGETWLHAQCGQGFASEYFVTTVEKAGLKLSLTAPGAGDYPRLGHLPGYGVVKSEKAEAGEMQFPIGNGSIASVQGKRLHLDYSAQAGTTPLSDLEATENYVAGVLAAGGELVYRNERNDVTARMPGGEQTVWLHVRSLFGNVELDVVEEKPFVPVATPPKSDALKAALDKDHHVALYVNFDFAKATLKPDAKPVIAQVLALLKDNPGYKLTIEGHTDNVGGAESNQKLSEARAAAVVAALVAGGIDASRLSSKGYGLSQPIADNKTSEGRAKNRRVELVKR